MCRVRSIRRQRLSHHSREVGRYIDGQIGRGRRQQKPDPLLKNKFQATLEELKGVQEKAFHECKEARITHCLGEMIALDEQPFSLVFIGLWQN